MEVKTFALSLGVGMLTGAAAALMLPKHSEAYRVANQAAKSIKNEAEKMLDAVKSH